MNFSSWLEAENYYDTLEIKELIALRDGLERDIKQERAAINPDNPHADLRSSIAFSTAKTHQIELMKVELAFYRKVGDKAMVKSYEKRLKRLGL
jgi:hypothetical protein